MPQRGVTRGTNQISNQCVVIHDFFSDRTLVRRIVQISDLSTFDGKVLSYHGCDG